MAEINQFKSSAEIGADEWAKSPDQFCYALAITTGAGQIQITITPENCDQIIMAIQSAQLHYQELAALLGATGWHQ